MRVVQFIQVIVLLALLGYVVLLALENPVMVTLPLPFGLQGSLPLGAVVGGAVLVGAVYASLLYIPQLIGIQRHFRQESRRRGRAEGRLRDTLQARLASSLRPSPALRGQDEQVFAELQGSDDPGSDPRNSDGVRP